MLQLGIAANIVISLAYYAIATIVLLALRRNGQLRSNPLGLATVGIFFSCGMGHSIHVEHAITDRMVFDWHLALWDTITAAIGVTYVTLRRSYGQLLKGSIDAEVAEVQAELGRALTLHETVVAGLHEGVLVMDAQLRIVSCNRRAGELLGLADAQLMGRASDDHGWQVVHPDGGPWPADDLPASRALRTGEPQLEELLGVHTPDGDLRWLVVSAQPLLDDGDVGGVSVSLVDVTERRQRERALEEAEEQLRAMFEASPIGVVVTDLDGRIVEANPALSTFLGRSRDALLGCSIQNLTHPDDRDRAGELLDDLRAGERSQYSVEKRFLGADGEPRWAQTDVTLLRDADGRPHLTLRQVQDIGDRRRHQAQLEHQADHDPLTGLLNRRGFARVLEQHLATTRRYGAEGALLLLDLDDFKYVNDRLGHKAGDELVVEVAALLRERLRGTDTVARLGGDEFAVLLPRGGRDEAEAVGAAIAGSVREHRFRAAPVRMSVTASVGVAPVAGLLDAEVLLVNADMAMYDAKEAGRDCVAVYAGDGDADPQVKARITWAERIRASLEGDGLTLLAQPIVDLQAGGTPMHELLLRMCGPGGELIAPASFLAVAERFDLVQDIDRWVVRRACSMLGRAQAAGTPLAFSVNVSARSLAGDGLLHHIDACLAESGVPAGALTIEITETAAVGRINEARQFARGLRELGCRLAIDDFGAGFGSFYYLKHLPFDYLKIDGEFVTHAPHQRADDLIVDAVRDLAHGLGRKVIAEFVSDAEVERHMRSKGIALAQGYHLGRPVPVEQILARATLRAV